MNRNKMKKCLRCSKDFEPKNPKGKFCSDKCRVYFSRGKKQDLPTMPKLNENMAWDKKQEEKKKSGVPQNLEELKAMCPKELSGFDRSDWISKNRVEYGV